MSALGHKQTCAVHYLMSALPPQAIHMSALGKVDFRIIELAASVHRDLRTGHAI